MPLHYNLSYQTLPFSIESIGNHWIQEPVQRLAGYPYFHWLQTEAGIGSIDIDGQTIGLPVGKGIFIAPFIPHTYYPHYYPQWQTSFVTFEGSMAEEISRLFQAQSYVTAEDSMSFSFSGWIEEQVALFGKDEPINQVELSTSAYHFLLQIQQAQDWLNTDEHQLYQSFIKPTIKRIETDYKEDLTVEMLAKELFISPQYLTRLFQRFLQTSTSNYLRQYRLNKAKELLINHANWEIQRVAEEAGFKDTSYFIASFKSITGYTPRAFRKLHRGSIQGQEKGT